jgi:hypothetical protein
MRVMVMSELVTYALTVAVTPAAVWTLLHAEEMGRRAVVVARRCHLLPAPPVLTDNPPVERIAADLRRLSCEMDCLPPGISAVKRRAVRLAYEDRLIAACRALEVPHALDELNDGLDRELERLQVEEALEHAGLRFRPATN